MCFVDQKDESFCTISWACNIDSALFVVAGGIDGIIRVIDASNENNTQGIIFRKSELQVGGPFIAVEK
ncbi:Uncharacterized protein TCM_031090 [Theobroma cacao]|uniref:Uncharacterized protein n=1 Tax=Theobroma cacao TaxID=3641 RepID=A0A061F5E1_THECC|nr:Uncharacterized protein TCM_031090 [Theobroma cacao]